MGQAIGQILPLAVGVAISPVPIIGVVLMLASQRARSNGPAFLVGWVAGLAVLGTVVLVLSSGAGASSSGTPATWVSILKLAVGALLLLVALREFRARPKQGEQPALPKWMQTIDRFTAGRSLAIGVALAAINPKNALITIGAAAAIAQTGVAAGSQAVALAVFIVIASVGVAAPVGIYFFLGERATKLLDELKTWMGANNAVIMAVLMLIIGVKLIGDAISGLSA